MRLFRDSVANAPSWLLDTETNIMQSPSMTESGPSRRVEPSGVSLRARPRSASEAIRRRVNQRLASTGTSFEPPEVIQTSQSAQTTAPKLRGTLMPVPSDRESHSPKRKKAVKADSKGADPSLGMALCFLQQ
jgi:hypothetical protein